jgi:hypothetical protein
MNIPGFTAERSLHSRRAAIASTSTPASFAPNSQVRPPQRSTQAVIWAAI